jgi:hypothetical protein
MERKGSSHVGSPDYDAEITHHMEERWRLIRESCQASIAQGDFSKRFWSRDREGAVSRR